MTTNSTVTTIRKGTLKPREKKSTSIMKGMLNMLILATFAVMAMSFTQEDTSRYMAERNISNEKQNCCLGVNLAKAGHEQALRLHKAQFHPSAVTENPLQSMILNSESITRADREMDLHFRENALNKKMAARFRQELQPEFSDADLQLQDAFNRWNLMIGFRNMLQKDAVNADASMDFQMNSKKWKYDYMKITLDAAKSSDLQLDITFMIREFGQLNFAQVKDADELMDLMIHHRSVHD